jgi:hypothetical protein
MVMAADGGNVKSFILRQGGKECISELWVPLLILLLILILISSPSGIRIKSKIMMTMKKENPKA